MTAILLCIMSLMCTMHTIPDLYGSQLFKSCCKVLVNPEQLSSFGVHVRIFQHLKVSPLRQLIVAHKVVRGNSDSGVWIIFYMDFIEFQSLCVCVVCTIFKTMGYDGFSDPFQAFIHRYSPLLITL